MYSIVGFIVYDYIFGGLVFCVFFWERLEMLLRMVRKRKVIIIRVIKYRIKGGKFRLL